MSFIDLFDNGKPVGRFNVPSHITSADLKIYRLERVVLGGGNGIVFRSHEMKGYKSVGTECAVKLLRQINDARIDRFKNEIRVMAELESPKISKLFASGEVEVTSDADGDKKMTVSWCAMELGAANMRQHVEGHGPLSMSQIKSVASDMCGAIEHLHSKGFIHRDIKPDNFVWKNDKMNSLMMIDFGIAKRFEEDVSGRPMDKFTQVTEFVGPVFFSSPELIQYASNKKHPVDSRSDIFQLGKIIWFLGTGKISAGIPSKKDCPAQGKLRDLVVHMIDDDPDSRPQSISEVLTAINAI